MKITPPPEKVKVPNNKFQFPHPKKMKIILQVLKTFNGIAMHYRMPLLKSVTEWSMKMNGWDA